MDIYTGTCADLTLELFTRLACYRHKVFVEMLGWKLPTHEDLEFDQFDRADTLYLVARNDSGQIIGTARLLPTTRPYLLSEVFPILLGDAPVPCSPKVWELSRFAAVDFDEGRAWTISQLSSPIAVELLRAAIVAATKRGAERLITVSPIGIERLLRKAGFSAYRAGPPHVIDGRTVFACFVECTPAVGQASKRSATFTALQNEFDS